MSSTPERQYYRPCTDHTLSPKQAREKMSMGQSLSIYPDSAIGRSGIDTRYYLRDGTMHRREYQRGPDGVWTTIYDGED